MHRLDPRGGHPEPGQTQTPAPPGLRSSYLARIRGAPDDTQSCPGRRHTHCWLCPQHAGSSRRSQTKPGGTPGAKGAQTSHSPTTTGLLSLKPPTPSRSCSPHPHPQKCPLRDQHRPWGSAKTPELAPLTCRPRQRAPRPGADFRQRRNTTSFCWFCNTGHQRRCLRISASSHAQVLWFPSCLLCENTAQAGWRAGGAPVRLCATACGSLTAPEPSPGGRVEAPPSCFHRAPWACLLRPGGHDTGILRGSSRPEQWGPPAERGPVHSEEHPCHGAAPRPQGKVNARRRGVLRSRERELCVRALGGFFVPPCMLLEKQRAFFEPWCPCCWQGSPQSPPGAAPRTQGTRQCEELSTGAPTRSFLQRRRTCLAHAQSAQRRPPLALRAGVRTAKSLPCSMREGELVRLRHHPLYLQIAVLVTQDLRKSVQSLW